MVPLFVIGAIGGLVGAGIYALSKSSDPGAVFKKKAVLGTLAGAAVGALMFGAAAATFFPGAIALSVGTVAGVAAPAAVDAPVPSLTDVVEAASNIELPSLPTPRRSDPRPTDVNQAVQDFENGTGATAKTLAAGAKSLHESPVGAAVDAVKEVVKPRIGARGALEGAGSGRAVDTPPSQSKPAAPPSKGTPPKTKPSPAAGAKPGKTDPRGPRLPDAELGRTLADVEDDARAIIGGSPTLRAFFGNPTIRFARRGEEPRFADGQLVLRPDDETRKLGSQLAYLAAYAAKGSTPDHYERVRDELAEVTLRDKPVDIPPFQTR